jgi:hypothetical protein
MERALRELVLGKLCLAGIVVSCRLRRIAQGSLIPVQVVRRCEFWP